MLVGDATWFDASKVVRSCYDDPGNSSAEIVAAIAVEHYFAGRSDTKHLWQANYVVPIGSAQFANVVHEVELGFVGSFEQTLQQTILILNQPEGEPPRLGSPLSSRGEKVQCSRET